MVAESGGKSPASFLSRDGACLGSGHLTGLIQECLGADPIPLALPDVGRSGARFCEIQGARGQFLPDRQGLLVVPLRPCQIPLGSGNPPRLCCEVATSREPGASFSSIARHWT